MKLENIFYINLEERRDRKEHVENELKKVGWDNYTRFNAIKNKHGRIGCSLSHLKVIQDAKKNKLPYVVILEDDIEFTNPELFQKLMKTFFDEKIDYDVYLIAGNLRGGAHRVHESILKVTRSFALTGYIVKQHYYDRIIKNISEGLKQLIRQPNNGYFAIDTYLMKLQEKDNWYISYPRTVTQKPDYSDIENKNVNYNHVMLDVVE